VTITTDKEISPQHRRTIGVDEGEIWVTNEFAGARMSDFYKVNDSLFQVTILPENHPINDSPWYAFKIWADTSRSIHLRLNYRHGEHRYTPKLSRDGKSWTLIDNDRYRVDTLNGTATMKLNVSRDTLWVSAQELVTQTWYRDWADSLAQKPFVRRDTAGYSHQGRPIPKLVITQAEAGAARGVLILISRLHPPEVTGNFASYAFIEELASDGKLAQAFRRKFEVVAYPFANPDGVYNGHWRHNAGGIDLNRDWQNFNQPETQVIRQDLLKTVKADSSKKVFYGIDFHSTNENIFYPINREIDTFPEDFTYAWVDSLMVSFPAVEFSVEPFDTTSPIAKNWIYKTFGADAVTYEVDDAADRQKLDAIARESARIIMRMLLNKAENGWIVKSER
jgi:hypothetical protein